MKNGLIIMLAVSLIACDGLVSERGNGKRTEKTVKVSSFSSIELSGGYEVELIPSRSKEINIETDENLMDYIEIEVNNEVLHIDSKRALSSPGGILISIPVKRLKKLNSSGASNVHAAEPISSPELAISLSGAGKIELLLDVKSLSLDLSGAAYVNLKGVVKDFNVTMSGAGSLEAEELEAEYCKIDISGVGSATVNVTEVLDAQVSGLGSVDYVGSPKSVKGDVSGVGTIDKIK